MIKRTGRRLQERQRRRIGERDRCGVAQDQATLPNVCEINRPIQLGLGDKEVQNSRVPSKEKDTRWGDSAARWLLKCRREDVDEQHGMSLMKEKSWSLFGKSAAVGHKT